MEELKKVIEDQDNAHLQDEQSHTKPPSLAAAVLEVENNDGGLGKIRDGLNTPPTSPLICRIQPILTCPLAPRKPKAAPLRKRKGSYSTELRLHDFSNDVLALYPPALLADFGNKVKRAKRGYHEQHQQLKENISTNINDHTS